MKGWIGSDIIGLVLTSILYYLVRNPLYLNLVARLIIYTSIIIIALVNVYNIFARSKLITQKYAHFLNSLAMFMSVIIIVGEFYGRILGFTGVWSGGLFGFYIFLAFISLAIFVNSTEKVENAFAVLLAVPTLIVVIGSQFLVFLIDVMFPPKVQELVPYIDALRTLILNISNTMADPERVQAQLALENLGDVNATLNEIGEGYALRKGIGQSIDSGLTAIVFALGAFTYFVRLGVPPQVLILLFGSLGLAMATFSGLFGPFYGIAGAAKDYSLHNGNYRGAALFKTIEEIFAIPFLAASAGFLLLDLPPIDAETLEDFKTEMQDQLTEISDNLNSLMGKSGSAVPRKTRKLVASMMNSTEENLSKLDFRNVREETAREFALSYYQHEFSWKPWRRKPALREFAEMNHFDLRTAEDTMKLIGYKIEAGQMDDDMVSNVMIASAMRGVIMMEEKYQSMLDSVELGQTCTGLAFGARQFIKDHYIVRSKGQKTLSLLKNLFVGIIAVPIILLVGFHKYFNRIYNMIGEAAWDQEISRITKLRYHEILNALIDMPSKLKSKRKKKKTDDEKTEEKKQRNWQLRRKITIGFSKFLQVLWFPFKLIIGTGKWIYGKFKPEEVNPRQAFEEAVAHAALVSMYNELYKKLVMQDHVFTTY